MKKQVLIFVQIFLILTCQKLQSQSDWLTNGGMFDTVVDSYTNKYLLKDIKIDSREPFKLISNPNAAQASVYGYTCSAGVFDLYFQNNMMVDAISTPSFIASVQTLVCTTFGNMSDFITTSSLTSVGAPRINIYVSSAALPGLAQARSIYVFPSNPLNPNQGFLDNLVQHMLLTSADPYKSMPIIFDNINSISSGFFHGHLVLNSSNNTPPWHVDLLSAPTATRADIYSTLIHEIGHFLGIGTQIGVTGGSQTSFSNYSYSRYDTKLHDSNGNPLLGALIQNGLCMSSLGFTASPTAIATATTGGITDITNCSTAVQYSGTAITLTVYTPNVFETGSSLSHLEDMCSAPYNPSACTPTPSSPGYNNLYFSMSNNNVVGGCGFKRYFREEERLLLCDLGYTVNTTYSCTAGILSFINSTTSVNYSSICTPDVVVGQNDGLVNGLYIYTTTTNSFAVPTSSILMNDLASSSLSMSCIEMVYSNSTTQFSAALSGSSLVVTGVPGSGLAVVKYTPVNSSGLFGNATYVFIYFVSSDCNPVNYCSMIQNGGFESVSGVPCGTIGGFPLSSAQVNCWEEYPSGIASAFLYSRNCNSGTTFNLGSNTLGSATSTVNSLNGFPNDHIIALTYTNGVSASAMKNNLSAPIVPGQVYNLSFWAINHTGLSTGANTNSNGNALIVTVACHTVFPFVPTGPFPAGLQVIAQYTIPAGTSWKKYSQPVVTPITQVNLSALVIGINSSLTNLTGSWSSNATAFCYIDEVSLIPNSYPIFGLGTPTICGNTSLNDLDIYNSFGSADFSGPYVTQNNGIYSFNLNSYLQPGEYPIQSTYTAGACTYSSYALVTVVTNTNFASLSNSVICSNTPTLNIDDVLYKTLAVSGGTYYVNGVVSGNTVGLTSPGSFTIGFAPDGVGLCSYNTVTSTILSHMVPTLSIFNGTTSVSATDLCIGYSFSVSAASSSSIITWQPGSLSGSIQAFSPSVTTVYTVSSYYNSSCLVTQTLAVSIVTSCCNGGYFPAFSASAITTNTILSNLLITNDFTVQPGVSLDLSGELVFSPNVKVTVSNNAFMNIQQSHLYACENTMWAGIVVENGGSIDINDNGSSGGNLIEDAITAVNISGHTSSTVSAILRAENTVFNKNYVDISISNYTKSGGPYPFFIDNCVFTCRDIPFTDVAWPQTGTVSSTSNSSADLRHAFAASPTTGLAPPYLNQSTFSITTLKYPYTGQRSNIAIRLNEVGINTSSVMYGITIGNISNAADFNLFDAHNVFIYSTNSNLSSHNNVFQNTTGGNFSDPENPLIKAPGAAIIHKTSSVMNAKLDLTASNFSTGNRFWNCHRGVLATNVYNFKVEYALFRTTQTSTAPAFAPVGMLLSTNRFDYYIANNEFTNLETAINIPLGAGTFTYAGIPLVGGSSFGIYADRLRIVQNKFTGQTSALANSYMHDAINITCPNAVPWYAVLNNTIIPVANAVAVVNNDIIMSSRAINLNGIKGFPALVENNVVVLKDDPSAIEQYAIKLTNCNPSIVGSPGAAGYGRCEINGNILSYSTVPTNTVSTPLVFCGDNGVAILSPSVTCNALTRGSKAFVFEAGNPQTIWAGNVMQPMANGLVLQGNAKIGPQGNSSFASANVWDGSWTGDHTFVDGFTDAQYSQLYVANITGNIPTNNSGPNPIQSYGQGNVFPADEGGYNCMGIPNFKVISLPDPENQLATAEQLYMENLDLYYFLSLNDSTKESGGGEMGIFFEGLAGSSIAKFREMENLIYQGDYTSANDLLGTISEDELNAAELNYKLFYTLYVNYHSNGELSEADSIALHDLAVLCPSTNGAAVYQAIALYNSIYNVILFPDCGESGARMAGINSKEKTTLKTGSWNIEVFPNPAKEQLTIRTPKENETLKVCIKDLSGRTVLDKNIEVKGFITTLDIDLINGAYIIYISNSNNDKTVKKLLISK